MNEELFILKSSLLERLQMNEEQFISLLKTFAIDINVKIFSQKQVDSFVSYLSKLNPSLEITIGVNDYIEAENVPSDKNLIDIFIERKKVIKKEKESQNFFMAEVKECKVHQEEAKNDILQSLTKSDRCKYISACGTGKTLVAQRVIEALIQDKDNSCSLILLPTLDLIIQFFNSIKANTKIKSHKRPLIVCSDSEISNSDGCKFNKKNIRLNIQISSLKIIEFLNGTSGHKLILCTYQSVMTLAEAIFAYNKNFYIDIAVFDEAHKTAGEWNKQFSYAMYDENIKIQKRLFMTATPKENLIDNDLYLGMENEALYGHIAHELTMPQAIERGIIKDYKIIIGVINKKKIFAETQAQESDEKIDNITCMAYALQEMLKAKEVKKGLIFHNTIYESQLFVKTIKKKGIIPDHQSYHIDGTMNTRERKHTLQQLAHQENIFVSNSKLLSEGIDVPSIEMIGMFSSSKSIVDIAQRIGRAQRKSSIDDVAPGYVFLPIFIQDDESLSFESLIEKSNFNDVLDIILCIREIDSRLKISINNLFDLFEEKNLKQHLEIIPINSLGTDIIEETILKGIKVAHYNNINNRWEINYTKVKQFIENFERMPKRTVDEEKTLSEWCDQNKKLRKKGLLSKEKIEKLDSINFIWHSSDKKWDEYFKKYVQFVEKKHREPKGLNKKKKHVSESKKAENLLAMWLSNQKSAYSKNLLTPDRVKKLEPYVETWSLRHHDLWISQSNKLKNFIIANGRFPKDVFENCEEKGIYRWFTIQRRLHNANKLSEKYKKILDDIDPDWILSSDDRIWKAQYSKVLDFILQSNRLPTYNLKDKSEHNLYLWMVKQKKAIDSKVLDEWKRTLMKSIFQKQGCEQVSKSINVYFSNTVLGKAFIEALYA